MVDQVGVQGVCRGRLPKVVGSGARVVSGECPQNYHSWNQNLTRMAFKAMPPFLGARVFLLSSYTLLSPLFFLLLPFLYLPKLSWSKEGTGRRTWLWRVISVPSTSPGSPAQDEWALSNIRAEAG